MRAHREIKRRLSDVYVANTNNVHVTECDIDKPDELSEHLGRIVRQKTGIVSCGLLFVPNLHVISAFLLAFCLHQYLAFTRYASISMQTNCSKQILIRHKA